ncbi:acyltransferase [[Pseudomonas] boreopolis]
MVMLFHARFPYLPGAFAGVDIFFVLGGYLITWMLQAEYTRNHRVDVQAFYIRRVGRLLPALVAMLAAYLCIAPLLWPGESHLLQALTALLGLADYTRAFLGVPRYLTHTWSLAVEHHFYLLWPLLLPWFLRRTKPLLLLGGVYLAAWGWRLVCLQFGQEWGEMYYRFDTRMSGLVLGSWLAVLLQRETARAWLWRFRHYMLSALPVVAMLMVTQSWKDSAFWQTGLPLLEIMVALLVAGGQYGDNWTELAGLGMGTLRREDFLWLIPLALPDILLSSGGV